MNDNRLKIISISPTWIRQLFLNKLSFEYAVIPEDARIVSVYSDWQTRSIEILVQSETFDEVPEGQVPPKIPVTLINKTVPVELGYFDSSKPLRMPDEAAEMFGRRGSRDHE